MQYPRMGVGKMQSTSSNPHQMIFCSKNAIFASIIFVLLNVGGINAFCDPYACIAFQEEK
jgi:hypothetical protein